MLDFVSFATAKQEQELHFLDFVVYQFSRNFDNGSLLLVMMSAGRRKKQQTSWTAMSRATLLVLS